MSLAAGCSARDANTGRMQEGRSRLARVARAHGPKKSTDRGNVAVTERHAAAVLITLLLYLIAEREKGLWGAC